MNTTSNSTLSCRFGSAARSREVVVDESFRELRPQRRGHERIERRAHVDVRVPDEIDEQRARADVAVAVLGALAGPDVVGDQVPVQTEREPLGLRADDLGRVPVRHHAVLRRVRRAGSAAARRARRGSGRARVSAAETSASSIGSGACDHRDGPHLEDVDPIVAGDRELDVERVVPDELLDVLHRQQHRRQRRTADAPVDSDASRCTNTVRAVAPPVTVSVRAVLSSKLMT